MSAPEPLPSEIEELRARAGRCREQALGYSSDTGASLAELAVELDRRADLLERAAPAGVTHPVQN